MAKKRTMNELRQTKEYQNTKGNELWPVKQVMAQQIDEDLEAAKQMAEIDKQESRNAYDKQHIKKEMNPSKYTEKDLEQAKEAIAEKIIKHFDDTIFEMVCDEMSNNYLFQSDNYLTEAGYDIWEDEWFEFYHEHHGDILATIHNKLIY